MGFWVLERVVLQTVLSVNSSDFPERTQPTHDNPTRKELEDAPAILPHSL